MTLEEAKKEIEERGDDAWKKWKKEGNLISQGYALGMDDALGIVDKLDTESSGNPEQLTLKELACELRKIFKFDLFTYSAWEDGDCYVTEQLDEIVLWRRRVSDALPSYDETAGNFYGDVEVLALLKISSMSAMVSESLDLSEYKDADGNIDYSKCIVEVKG